MHSEPGGAFQPRNIEEVKNIKLYWHDDLFEASVACYSLDVDYFEHVKLSNNKKLFYATR